MRTSNQSVDERRTRRLRAYAASVLMLSVLVAGCASPPPSVAPVTPKPTPVVTPNPQLTDPASADALFTAIARAKLPIAANNAQAGKDPVKQISATYRDWPMRISEYTSAASLAKARPWTLGDPPGKGEPPVSIIGLNILIEWGPVSGAKKPPALDPAQVKAMNDFLKAIGPYVGPLVVRTTTGLAVPGVAPAPTPSPSASAKASALPSKKPAPSKKPTAAP